VGASRGCRRTVSDFGAGASVSREFSITYSERARFVLGHVKCFAMPFDTSSAVTAKHNQMYREIGPAGRARIAAELSDALRQLAIAGVRLRRPELSDKEARAEALVVFYGRDVRRR